MQFTPLSFLRNLPGRTHPPAATDARQKHRLVERFLPRQVPTGKALLQTPTAVRMRQFGVTLASSVKVGTIDGRRVKPDIVSPELLLKILNRRKSPPGMGRFVSGIPHTSPNHEVRSITVLNPRTVRCVTVAFDANGEVVTRPEQLVKYAQQSMSKPVAEALAKKLIGMERFTALVGCEASGAPYDADVTFSDRPGVPCNGNVNIGALKVWDILVSEAKVMSREQGREVKAIDLYLDFLKKMAGDDSLEINEAMALGEFSYQPPDGEPSTNMKLLAKLRNEGSLDNAPEEVYLPYCQACAAMINTEMSARIRYALETGKHPHTGEQLLDSEMAGHTVRATTVSGMYDESGEYFVNIGVNGAKSGVDGGIMCAIPTRIPGNPDLIVAVHHAGLNPRGNSHEGTEWLKDLSRMTLIFPDDPLLLRPATLARGAVKHVKGSLLEARSTGSTGPANAASDISAKSPEDIDRELRRELRESLGSDALERLETAIKAKLAEAGTGYKGGFYLTRGADGVAGRSDGSDMSAMNGSLVLEEAGTDGRMHRYYHVPDRHHLEKVVVTEGKAQS